MAGTGDNCFTMRGYAMSDPEQACLEAIEFLQRLGYWHIDWPEGEKTAHVVMTRGRKNGQPLVRPVTPASVESWTADVTCALDDAGKTTVVVNYRFRTWTWPNADSVVAMGEAQDLLAWLENRTVPTLDRRAQLVDARRTHSIVAGTMAVFIAIGVVSLSWLQLQKVTHPWLLPGFGLTIAIAGALYSSRVPKPRNMPLNGPGPNLPLPGVKFDPMSWPH